MSRQKRRRKTDGVFVGVKLLALDDYAGLWRKGCLQFSADINELGPGQERNRHAVGLCLVRVRNLDVIVNSITLKEAIDDLHVEALRTSLQMQVFRAHHQIGVFTHGRGILLAHAGAQVLAGHGNYAESVGFDCFLAAVDEVSLPDEVCHEGCRGIFVELHRRADLFDLAAVHDHDAIRHRERFFLIVRHV